MPHRHRSRPHPDQLCLLLDDPRNRPPEAPVTPDILEALAELMLAAAEKMVEGSDHDAREDHS